jgi:hypothetical protein
MVYWILFLFSPVVVAGQVAPNTRYSPLPPEKQAAIRAGKEKDCPPLLLLERTSNRNKVFYEYSGGDEVHAFWRDDDDGGIFQGLTSLERSWAYGPTLLREGGKTYFRLAFDKNLRIEIRQNSEKCYEAWVDGKRVSSVFVRISGSGIFASVEGFEWRE